MRWLLLCAVKQRECDPAAGATYAHADVDRQVSVCFCKSAVTENIERSIDLRALMPWGRCLGLQHSLQLLTVYTPPCQRVLLLG
jgi:hypothetical protein